MSVTGAYRFHAARVAVETDDGGAARWLAEFVAPWFEACAAHPADRRVRFVASGPRFDALTCRFEVASAQPVPCFGLDREVAAHPGWADAAATVAYDAELGAYYRVTPDVIDVVARPGFPRARIGLMRVVREVLVGAAQAHARRLDLHAAAVATPDGAIVIAGPKNAGKTTLLTWLLSTPGAALIANDRVLVDVSPPSAFAHGVPSLVSIRAGTLGFFPALRHAVDERPALLHAGELAAPAPGPQASAFPAREFSLAPAQFAARCGAGLRGGAPVAVLVFPAVDGAMQGWSLDALSTSEGSARLLESRYGVCAVRRPATIFDRASYGDTRTDEVSPAQIARLAHAVPLFACRMGAGAFREPADALRRALLGVRPAASVR